MTAQYSRGFPGMALTGGKLQFSRSATFESALQSLYEAYLSDNYAYCGVTAEYASGLDYFLNIRGFRPPAVKGHVTGPVSWCLGISDETGKSILYDDILADAAARMLAMSGRWQEDQLKHVSPNTLIFIDEPAMSSYGSAFFSLPADKVKTLIKETLSKLTGLKGIHCCGNTDWSLVLDTGIDVLSFDAFNYGESLSLYPAQLSTLLARGGAVAWGIVPGDETACAAETVSSLKDRLEDTVAKATPGGFTFKHMAKSSLLTPSCSLAAMSEEGAGYALELLAGLSEYMQKRHI